VSDPSPINGVLRTVTADGLREAVDSYVLAQDELVEARNRLASAIAGAAMSGMTQGEIVELTGYPTDLVLRICTDAGVSEADSAPQKPLARCQLGAKWHGYLVPSLAVRRRRREAIRPRRCAVVTDIANGPCLGQATGRVLAVGARSAPGWTDRVQLARTK
jgi:hypothetical protein